ncbi:MAG: lamin tail domain-containing protein, partial [Anaerolineales bacterium]
MSKLEGHKMYDLREVAEMLDVELQTVHRWIDHEMVPALDIGGRYVMRGLDLFMLGEISEPPEQVQVDIARSQFRVSGRAKENLQGQYVCIDNEGPSPVDLSGWHLQNRRGTAYDFGHFRLKSGEAVRLRTGKGRDTEKDLYWGLSSS